MVPIHLTTEMVKLPGSSWRLVTRNDSFVVPPQASFDIDAPADVAYICYYK
jgi:uncharacterized protein YaiE (UPF0345 family)